MNLIQPFLDQTRQTFLAMPMPSRIISVMLILAIAIGLGLLVRGDGKEATEYLFGGRAFSGPELDSIELAFGRANLTGWERGEVRMEIPTTRKNEFIAALNDAPSLPLSIRTSLEQTQAGGSYFESSDRRTSREMHAKERDLSRKIEKFPEVHFASVEYDIGERIGLGRKRAQSASVLVEPVGLERLPPGKVDLIKKLISGSFADLDTNDVTVIDTNDSFTGTASEEEDLLRRRQEAVERSYVNKVRTLLKDYGEIRVLAFAEIDPTMDAEKAALTYEEPTTIEDNTVKQSSETTRTLNEGVPGTATNVAQNRPLSLEKTVQTSKESADERQSEKVAGQRYEQSRLASFQTKRVRISIALPDSYYTKVWQHQNPTKDPNDPADMDPVAYEDELTQIKEETGNTIKRLVTTILPDITAGEDKFDQLVEVGEYPDLAEPPINDSQTTQKALTWLAQSWQTIALVVLGLTALLVARSAARAGGGDTPPAEFSEGFGLEIPDPPIAAESTHESSDSMTITGSSLKDELVELVEKNPEVAANVIRGWVGEAA